MAVTITRITGIGGSPPAQIRVEGTVSGCEFVQVMSSCSSNPAQIPIQTGGLNQWSVDIPNDKGCPCGTPVKITAWCGLGEPGTDSVTVTLTLDCGDCPIISISVISVGPCINGKRSVTYQATVNGIPATGAVLQWSFPNGNPVSPNATTAFVVSANGILPNQTVEYSANSPNPVTQTVSILTILPQNCPAATATVTIEPCPACCPSVTLSQPIVSGCAPTNAVASFSASLSWPEGCTAVTPSSYDWTLNGPGNLKYQRSTSQPNTDTNSPWIDVSNGNSTMVQFTGGNYSIAVSAIIPGTVSPCIPTDSKPFQVSACCPQLIGPLNASEKQNDPCTWLFSAQLNNPSNSAVTFEWTFHDGTTASSSVPQIDHTYTPGSSNTGITSLTLKSPGCPDQTLSVTITHKCKQASCPPGQHRDANGNCVPDTPPPPPPSGGFNLCAGLLITAVSLMLIGGIIVIVGVCINVPYVWIAGGIVAGLGLALFALWVAICSRFTPCSIMRTVHCILFWIVAVVAPVITLLASILGGLPCFIAAAAAWGGWGTIYAWLGFVMRRVSCTPTC